jgi:uncharacterized protein YuzE
MIHTSYDFSVDALYVLIADTDVARTEQLDAGTLVDLDADGAVVGVEVLRPGRVWPLADLLSRYAFSDEDAALLGAMFPAAPTSNTVRGGEHGWMMAYQDRAYFGEGIRVAS